MSRGRPEEGGFRADHRLIRRELMTAALGAVSAALPARAEEQSGKMSQIAAAYQGAKRLVQLRRLHILHPPEQLRGGERRYQPDRLVQGFRLARLTGRKICKRR
jgi:hypothetical protein